jgi:hypothetical protein
VQRPIERRTARGSPALWLQHIEPATQPAHKHRTSQGRVHACTQVHTARPHLVGTFQNVGIRLVGNHHFDSSVQFASCHQQNAIEFVGGLKGQQEREKRRSTANGLNQRLHVSASRGAQHRQAHRRFGCGCAGSGRDRPTHSRRCRCSSRRRSGGFGRGRFQQCAGANVFAPLSTIKLNALHACKHMQTNDQEINSSKQLSRIYLTAPAYARCSASAKVEPTPVTPSTRPPAVSSFDSLSTHLVPAQRA